MTIGCDRWADQYEGPDGVVEECAECDEQEDCTRRLIAHARLQLNIG